MPRIVFVSPTGEERAAEVKSGGSVMEAAVANGVAGIEAQCYGACICGTCHVYVHEAWREKVGDRSEWEGEILAGLPLACENSRLSCQIPLREDLDGLIVLLPVFQGEG